MDIVDKCRCEIQRESNSFIPCHTKLQVTRKPPLFAHLVFVKYDCVTVTFPRLPQAPCICLSNYWLFPVGSYHTTGTQAILKITPPRSLFRSFRFHCRRLRDVFPPSAQVAPCLMIGCLHIVCASGDCSKSLFFQFLFR